MSLNSETCETLRQPPPLMRIKKSPYRAPSRDVSKSGGKNIVYARSLFDRQEAKAEPGVGAIMPSISTALSMHRSQHVYVPRQDRVRKLSPDHLSNCFSEPVESEDVRRHVMPQVVENNPSTRGLPQLKNPSRIYKSSIFDHEDDEEEEQQEQNGDISLPIGLAKHKHSVPSLIMEPYLKQDQAGSIPVLTDQRGEMHFNVHLGERESSTKSPNWLRSTITQKLYTLMNKAIPFNPTFDCDLPKDFTERFTIRAMAVFTSQQSLRSTVMRCPNHVAESDSTNRDFPHRDHVIRADHPHAKYEGHDGERRSVVVPLETQGDCDSFMPILLRFMCLGSCVGGINRRPIAVVLTLESEGRVYGRKVIQVRVCACPTRDIRSDEAQMLNRENGKRIISDIQVPLPKVLKKKRVHSVPSTGCNQEDGDYFSEDSDRITLTIEGSTLIKMMLQLGDSYLQWHSAYALKYPNEELRELARRYLHSADM